MTRDQTRTPPSAASWCPPWLVRLARGLHWLYAPDLLAAGYALRTTLTSLLALGIALWMELDSPQWAALTVWMVAQGTRGRSLAKARWHLFGMVVGVICAVILVGAFPQATLMFFLCLAGGIGLFCLIGTFLPGPAAMTNYRIHGMRASGFTYAIISLGGLEQPDHIFTIAASRATYIVLGVVLEATISGLFQLGLQKRTRRQLASSFEEALKPSLLAVGDILTGEAEPAVSIRTLFSRITALGDQVEFAEVELRHQDHAGDHVRAALGEITILLAHALDLATLLRLPDSKGPHYRTESDQLRRLCLGLPARLEDGEPMAAILAELRHMRHICRRRLVTDLRTSRQGEDLTSLMRHGTLQESLIQLIDSLRMILQHFEASRNPKPGDHFHAPIPSYRDWGTAVTNSLRAAVTVFGAGLIWLCTAWPSGMTFLLFVSIVCSLFSTLERPALASRAFLHGTVCAAIVGAFVNIGLMGHNSSYEYFAFFFGIVTFMGGLAFANPPTTLAAVSYNLFLPIISSPTNHGRISELAYFNIAPALVLGMAYATWMFRGFLPYSPSRQRWSMRQHILRDLHHVASGRPAQTVDDIIGRNVDRFVRLLTNAGDTPPAVLDVYLAGILSSMRVMFNLLRLQKIHLAHRLAPRPAHALALVLRRMEHFSGRYQGHYGRTLRATRLAITYLRRHEAAEPRLSERFLLVQALASLDVIATELQRHQLFYDARHDFIRTDDDGTRFSTLEMKQAALED